MGKRPLADRFWEKVDKTGDCWLWTAALFRNGYGLLRLSDTRCGTTHRMSWKLHYGSIPHGLFVLHHCDANYPPGDMTYRRCVRPDHLWLGTNIDNMADMATKHRAASGERHYSRVHPESVLRGERNGFAKLTAEAVTSIRGRYIRGVVSQSQLAVEAGVSRATVQRVVTGRAWAVVA